ncbi:hypothetical protein [Arenibacter algicola]
MSRIFCGRLEENTEGIETKGLFTGDTSQIQRATFFFAHNKASK